MRPCLLPRSFLLHHPCGLFSMLWYKIQAKQRKERRGRGKGIKQASLLKLFRELTTLTSQVQCCAANMASSEITSLNSALTCLTVIWLEGNWSTFFSHLENLGQSHLRVCLLNVSDANHVLLRSKFEKWNFSIMLLSFSTCWTLLNPLKATLITKPNYDDLKALLWPPDCLHVNMATFGITVTLIMSHMFHSVVCE